MAAGTQPPLLFASSLPQLTESQSMGHPSPEANAGRVSDLRLAGHATSCLQTDGLPRAEDVGDTAGGLIYTGPLGRSDGIKCWGTRQEARSSAQVESVASDLCFDRPCSPVPIWCSIAVRSRLTWVRISTLPPTSCKTVGKSRGFSGPSSVESE